MSNVRGRSTLASYVHRLKRMRDFGSKPPLHRGRPAVDGKSNASIDCGWGRLFFGQTFADSRPLIEALGEEGPERRDIAFYVREPHVLLGYAPQEIFLDPSHTFRLDLSTYRPSRKGSRGFFVRRLATEADAREVNRIYHSRHMVPVDPAFFFANRHGRELTYLVAEDENTGAILGTVTGVHHGRAFDDPEHGASLWCLAIDAQAPHSAIGEALVRRLAEHFQARGCAFMDLSVLHDNAQAIALYERLGFERVPFFAVKRRNQINEKLFTAGSCPTGDLNPYARLIVDEAHRRGIHCEIIDAAGGFFRLTHGGRTVRCRESLSELTSAVALSICDDKSATRRLVSQAGVTVPAQIVAGDDEGELERFLIEHRSVVVKPARGEQGRGIAVGVETMEELREAVRVAKAECPRILVEACFEGDDLRLVVIDYRLVAAAIRCPPSVTGDGNHSVRELISSLSRRRQAATGGESRVPLDGETERAVRLAGFEFDDILPSGHRITVRRTANLHTGGTIHDVTDIVHPRLVEAAVAAARAIDIPVTGIDLMIKDPRKADYVFIEANERPGLANHEPQPTAERFVDLLFPLSMPASTRSARTRRGAAG